MTSPQRPAGPPNQAPSLARALNSTSLGKEAERQISIEGKSADEVKDALKYVLAWIGMRLYGSAYLVEAWETSEGRGDIQDPQEDEEQWARLMSELLLFMPYGMPAVFYKHDDQRSDRPFFNKIMEADPAYPIVSACQQFCTMAALSRGLRFKNPRVYQFESTGGAAQTEALWDPPSPETPKDPHWFTDPAYKDNTPRAVKEKHLAAGGIYAWQRFGHNDKNQLVSLNGCHAAFVLRVNKQDGRIQFFDTGAMGCQPPEYSVPKALLRVPESAGVGSYEYQWTVTIPGPLVTPAGAAKDLEKYPDAPLTAQYAGMGIVPRSDLPPAIEHMRMARPLGLARLVLRRISTNRILYASPLLFMHDMSHPFANYSMARYLYTLRRMPGREEIDATWVVYLPQRGLTMAMLGGNRSTTLGSILQTAFKGNPPDSLGNDNFALPLMYLSTATEKDFVGVRGRINAGTYKPSAEDLKHGLVVIRYQRSRTAAYNPGNPPDLQEVMELPWNRPSGSIELSRSEFDFPYLAGEWDGKSPWNKILDQW
jgi:hypothetical protein